MPATAMSSLIVWYMYTYYSNKTRSCQSVIRSDLIAKKGGLQGEGGKMAQVDYVRTFYKHKKKDD
jgi:hypothetical protein